ncbi:MAG: 4-hydroxybenzoate octaprenyltransferase [Coxiellaceae bacterium]|nr:4-hydroxybenzoate octaprenyltransferase [Coxiellaceae bacterium]|tara:strand:+ start:3548 stop:4417 length:870 start_codon:yes stop_codon:yes gene_type:complete
MWLAACIRQRFSIYLRLIRWDKPVGSLLLLWPTLSALWLASEGTPSLSLIIIFVLGVFVMRAAGCVINDIADRQIDGLVKRTQDRPLAQKELSTLEALCFFITLIIIALGLVLLLPSLCLIIALCALCFAVVYPWTKRWLPYPQIVLGIAFNAGILMAYGAVQHTLPFVSWFLYMTAVIWTFGYDTIYAMVDQDDDLLIGINSSAISLGKQLLFVVGGVYICIILCLLLLGIMVKMNLWYYAGVTLCSFLFIRQMYWIRSHDTERCFQAFLANHRAWLILLLGIIVNYL